MINGFPVVFFWCTSVQVLIDLVAVSAIQTRRCGNGDLDPTVQEQRSTSKHRD